MRIGKISLAALAVVTMATTPVVAQVVSTQSARASVSAEDENGISGSKILIIALIAGIAAGAIIAISNDEDAPTSP